MCSLKPFSVVWSYIIALFQLVPHPLVWYRGFFPLWYVWMVFFMYVAQLGCVMHQLAIHCSTLLILGSDICMYSRNIMYISTYVCTYCTKAWHVTYHIIHSMAIAIWKQKKIRKKHVYSIVLSKNLCKIHIMFLL